MSDRYAVIGKPIGFGKSPLIHGRFAAATGQDLEYTKIEGPLGGFAWWRMATRARLQCTDFKALARKSIRARTLGDT
jgi:shikimate 5-dehydrogenase